MSPDAQRLYVNVIGFFGDTNTYEMRVRSLGCEVSGPVTPDRIEIDDSLEESEFLQPELYRELTITPGDQDWIALDMCLFGDLLIDVFYQHAQGDINITLYDEAGFYLDSSNGSTGHEQIEYSSWLGQRLYIQIEGGDPTVENHYDLLFNTYGCF